MSLPLLGGLHTFRSVPDRRVRNIPEVVLIRRWVSWGSGNLEGEGGRGWERGGSRFSFNMFIAFIDYT